LIVFCEKQVVFRRKSIDFREELIVFLRKSIVFSEKQGPFLANYEGKMLSAKCKACPRLERGCKMEEVPSAWYHSVWHKEKSKDGPPATLLSKRRFDPSTS
jgi:hypothetical protein